MNLLTSPDGIPVPGPGDRSLRKWSEPRPLLRGYVHLASALVTPLATAFLLMQARSPSGYVGSAVFGVCVFGLFGVSAFYHLIACRARITAFARVDHAAIYLAIAGIYTPFCLQALDLTWGLPLLATVWAFAALGAFTRMVERRPHRRMRVVSYVVLGWLAVVPSVQLFTALGWAPSSLVLGAAAAYTAGAVVYALRQPNPFPQVLGFHELFHLLVTLATGAIYATLLLYVVPG